MLPVVAELIRSHGWISVKMSAEFTYAYDELICSFHIGTLI